MFIFKAMTTPLFMNNATLGKKKCFFYQKGIHSPIGGAYNMDKTMLACLIRFFFAQTCEIVLCDTQFLKRKHVSISVEWLNMILKEWHYLFQTPLKKRIEWK